MGKKKKRKSQKKTRERKKINLSPAFKGPVSVVKKTLTECNIPVIIMVIALSIFGVIMVFSAGYYETVNMDKPDTFYYLRKQGMYAVTGLIIMFFVSNIDYHKYSRWSKVILGVSIFLLLVLMTPLGVNVNGATRWIYIGITITPSEISKLCIIIWTSVYFNKYPRAARHWMNKGLMVVLLVMMLHAGLIMMQPNLSTAIVVCAIMVALSIVAGMNLGYIAGLVAAGGIGTLAILTLGKNTHWYSRITSFANPFAVAQGDGYQVTQGLIALGNGGLKGLGWGNSISKNLYLPEPQNDFILAIIGEELGFIGVCVLILAYMYLLYQCIMIAIRAKDRLGMFLATGVSVMLALHVIINVAVVTASMPATGITLPFVSSGGTSIWVFMAGMGIVLNVSRGQKSVPLVQLKSKNKSKEHKSTRKVVE